MSVNPEYESQEFPRFSPEELTSIARQQAEPFAFAMTPTQSLGETQAFADHFADSLDVHSVESEELYLTFPPKSVRSFDHRRRIILFDTETQMTLAKDLQPGNISPLEIAHTQLAAGIVDRLYKERLRRTNDIQHENLNNKLSSPNDVIDAIKTGGILDIDRQARLSEALFRANSSTLSNLNYQRFVMGMVLAHSHEPQASHDAVALENTESYEYRLTKQCTDNLGKEIASDKTALNLHIIGALLVRADPTDRVTTAWQMLAEHIPSFELAACFPMRMDELRVILDLSRPYTR